MKTQAYIFVLTQDYQVSYNDGTFGKFIMTCLCSEQEACLLREASPFHSGSGGRGGQTSSCFSLQMKRRKMALASLFRNSDCCHQDAPGIVFRPSSPWGIFFLPKGNCAPFLSYLSLHIFPLLMLGQNQSQ